MSGYWKSPGAAPQQQPREDDKHAKKIAELCHLAGKPELAAQFIAQGTSPADVRATLAAAAPRNIFDAAAVAEVYSRRAAQVAGHREKEAS